MHILPTKLYSCESIQEIERVAITKLNIPGYDLMRRAGQAVFDFIQNRFTTPVTLLVICGAGNNAGDGYVIARIADQQGWKVKLVSLIDTENLKGDAKQACEHWLEVGEILQADINNLPDLLNESDLVIDAILGTGTNRDVSTSWQRWIDAINASENSVVSVDVPSGLNADTGHIMGAAICADITVTFIGLKKGCFTASGKACCGEIIFNDLAVPEQAFAAVDVAALLINEGSCHRFSPRRSDTHKGHYGHVLVIGGNTGMPGAVILAAKSALKTGAGRVSVVTKKEHVTAVASVCPELMVYPSQDGDIPEHLLNSVTCIVIGPGLGQDAWAQRLLYRSFMAKRPLIIDADALNIVALQNSEKLLSLQVPKILTPHPGEAAALLSTTTADIQRDRFSAAHKLHQKYDAVIVLKGSGSLIYGGKDMSVCMLGNPAMSVAGMGDVLNGVIAGCFVQGLALEDAAKTGVFYHALAADLAANSHTRGMLASDVIDKLPQVVN